MAEEEVHKVSLNVYDLSQGLARQLSTAFLGKAIEGIWHTGVVVYGSEYYFGGGIQHATVGTTPYGTPLRVIELGETQVPKDVFEAYLDEISPRYTAETYSLLTHNCNNFTNEVSQFLVGTNIPDYILNLPNEVMNSPGGALMMPMIQQLEATLRANAVPQAPQFKPTAVNSTTTQPPSITIKKPETSGGVAVPQAPQFKPTAVNSTTTQPPSITIKKPETSGGVNVKESETKKQDEVVKSVDKEEKTGGSGGDPLGDARSKVQEEISREFAALMATGTLRASEAATLATRKVMQRYGLANVAQS